MGVKAQAKRRILLTTAVSLFALIVSGCGTPPPRLSYLALLAPFEGRYREVGYDLLYATRLGLADAQLSNVELLPIDDGDSTQDAVDRARALALNSDVRAVLVGGVAATAPETLEAFDDLPVVVIGGWGVDVNDDDKFVLASASLSRQLTPSVSQADIEATAVFDTAIIGSEIFGLKQLPDLHDDLSRITVITSAAPPDATFRERFLTSGLFVPEPGLLVTLAYDAAKLTAQAISDDQPTRRVVRDRIATIDYSGLNGSIRFEDGYWADAPIFEYRYTVEGLLQTIDEE